MPSQFPYTAYFDRRFNCEAVKLLPGEHLATAQHKVIIATLGSSVSACLFDPIAGVGGLTHFLLPSDSHGFWCQSSVHAYAIQTLDTLLGGVKQLGGQHIRLKVKLFGDANLLQMSGKISSSWETVTANFVTNYFQSQNIAIINGDLGQTYARKIYFFPKTGDVLMKKITRLNNDTIFARESEYRYQLSLQLRSSQPTSGDFKQHNATND
ncbi:hypothetical protein [Salinimonas chungwhensis]|uniref:hypothetical protein n=1 Tax=Salinimonas chungwhensis TaxID=265425 RepID=UPI00036088F7|nr:hypothetical protein [Salinimonas chungwhensis]